MAEIIAFPEQVERYNLQLAAGAEDFVVGMIITPERVEYEAGPSCLNVDDLLGFSQIRESARSEAYRIVEQNKQNLWEGLFDDVPLDVDAMGTISKVEKIGKIYGKQSAEYTVAHGGWSKDCRRKVAEICRKNGSEYFDVTTQTLDEATDDLYADGLSVGDMLRNGLSPLTEPEELDLRINDFVRLETHKILVKSSKSSEVAAFGIRPCPDWAIKDMYKNPKGAHGGYVPEIDKLMLDFDTFDSQNGQVFHEQIAVPGKLLNPDIINETYRRLQIIPYAQQLTRLEIHNTVGIVNRSKINEAVEFLELLDDVASEMHGFPVFVGEQVNENHPRDYNQFKVEAAKRRDEQEVLSQELQAYGEELYEKNTDHVLATLLIEKFLQDRLLATVVNDPEGAAMVFDNLTAAGFKQAIDLETQGKYMEAQNLRIQTRVAAPAVSSCGAGSCGLERVLNGSDDAEAVKKLGFNPNSTLLDKGGRKCKGCNKEQVVYDTVKKMKGCTKCGATTKYSS
jgi:ribosomal protein S27E